MTDAGRMSVSAASHGKRETATLPPNMREKGPFKGPNAQ
jgi:hypothetical protein